MQPFGRLKEILAKRGFYLGSESYSNAKSKRRFIGLLGSLERGLVLFLDREHRVGTGKLEFINVKYEYERVANLLCLTRNFLLVH